MSSIPGSLPGAAGQIGPQQREGPLGPVKAGRMLEDRLDTVGWGLLFLLVGALAMPTGVGEFASVAVVGALLLTLNVARVAAGVPVSWLSVILGATALAAGLGAMAGMRIDAFVLFFALLGAVTVASAVVRRR